MIPINYDLPLAYRGDNYGPITLHPKDSNGNYLNLSGRAVNAHIKNKKNCATVLSWSTSNDTIRIDNFISEDLSTGSLLVLKEIDGCKMQIPHGSYVYDVEVSSENNISTYYKGNFYISGDITQAARCIPTQTPTPTSTPTPTPTSTPTPTPTLTHTATEPPPLATPFYTFYAPISREGAEDDFIAHTYDSTTFRYNSGAGTQTVSFTDYITNRISSYDRITAYYYNPFAPENKDIIYELNWLQKPGQTSNNILAFFLIPASYGSLLEVADDNNAVSVIPPYGRFENSQGYFNYSGVTYKLYQAWDPQTEGVTASTKFHKFIN